MKVIIQKPDLDTCLTALIMGITTTIKNINLICSVGDASPDDLHNPQVLCIEAGGTGLMHLLNFDHHDPHRYFPPACKQAYDYKVLQNPILGRLVRYVCIVDEAPQNHPLIAFPSLSNIFSGMLIIEKESHNQFYRGVSILKTIMEEGIDPFNTMPDREEWREYRKAKEENLRMVQEVLAAAEYRTAKNGMKVGYVQSSFIGGIGTLYQQGCHAAILFNPSFGQPPVRKFTIAGNGINISHLLGHLLKMEEGWGGRNTIIGSPRHGSTLSVEKVLDLVLKCL